MPGFVSTGKFRGTTHRLVTANIASELPMHCPAGPFSAWAEAVPAAPVRIPVVNAPTTAVIVAW